MSRVSLSCLLAVLLPVLAAPSPTLAQEAAAPEPAREPAETPAEAPTPDPNIASGRDISSKRDLPLVWSEIVQVRDKMMEVENKRSDMRAVTLSPQEQALFVAYSKRLHDLTKELDARGRPQLDSAHQVKLRRALRVTQSALGSIRSIAASPVHRDLPEELRVLSISLKVLYAAFPDAPKTLGPEGLPSKEELRWKGHAGPG